jgi:hypothetical protein
MNAYKYMTYKMPLRINFWGSRLKFPQQTWVLLLMKMMDPFFEKYPPWRRETKANKAPEY